MINPRLALIAAFLAFIGAFSYILSAETPYGSVRGTLTAAESGTPLPGKKIILDIKDDWRYTTHTDDQGRFWFPRVEAGIYHLSAWTKAHESPNKKDRTVRVEEDHTTHLTVELKPMKPFLNVLQQERVFTSREPAQFHLMGFAPTQTLQVAMYEVSPDAAPKYWNGGLSSALTPHGGEIEQADLDAIHDLRQVETLPVSIAARDPEGVFRQVIPLGQRAPGMYVVSIRAGATQGIAAITVTDLALVVKASSHQLLAYATNMETGTPLPGVDVTMKDEKDALLGSGRTDATGMISLPVSRSGDSSGVRVLARHDRSIAAANVSINTSDDKPLHVYAYTDRPVYRPGQKVYFKAITRLLNNETYTVPPVQSGAVRVTDEKQNVAYEGSVATNAWGSLSGQFNLDAQALPGSYTLTLTLGGQTYDSSFAVAEYRKPEIEVKVSTDKKRLTLGEPFQATVKASYYYGAPVAHAKVDYSVTRATAWYTPDAEEWDEDLVEPGDGEGYDYGEPVLDAHGETDGEGRLVITLPTEAPPDASPLIDGTNYNYTVTATVTDLSHRTEDGSAQVMATQGDYRLSAESEDFVVEPGHASTIRVNAADFDGKPISGATGEATLARVEWERGREKPIPIWKGAWRADAAGAAHFTVTPDTEGDFRVIVRATDARGHVITASAWVWAVSDQSASFNYPYNALDVKADRKQYREGDLAEILVNTKYAPITGLLSLEGNRLLQHRSIRLTGKTTVLKIPITQEMMPAARLTLCFVKNKEFISAETTLNVSRERKALRVEVKPDHPTYLPGQTAMYHVRTLDTEGKPVPAEVSLGVVDEALYAIQADVTENISAFFYPKILYGVQTTFSSPNLYLSGDEKASSTIQTRRRFEDTAFWTPSVVTDANGSATVTVPLPDNLTTWRATCRAATLDTQVGQTTAKAITQKPFLVQLETPRFFVQGDEAVVTAVANNLTSAPLTATVGLDAKGMETRSPLTSEVRLDPGQTRRVEWRVTLQAPGDLPIRVWGRAGALNDAMELTLPVRAKGRERTDTQRGWTDASGTHTLSEDIPLVVDPHAVPGTVALKLRLSPSMASALLGSLDYLATYPYGCAEQTMSSFLPDLAVMDLLQRSGADAADLRRKLPAMVNSGLLRLYGYQHNDGGWRWWTYDDSDPWMTAFVMFGLNAAKNANFPVTDSAYTSGRDALKKMADETKLPADTRAFIAFTLAQIGETDAARGAVASLLGGGSDRSRLTGWSDWGRAMLAHTLSLLSQPEEAQRQLEAVWRRYSDTGLLPVEPKKSSDEGEWRSPAEQEAVLLWAALAVNPSDSRIPGLARRLLDRRRFDHWESTRDTAFALLALSRYLGQTQELKSDLTATVTVNGQTVTTRRFTTADAFRPEIVLPVNARLLAAGPMRVAIRVTGAGRLYHSVELTQTVAGPMTDPVAGRDGMTLERTYRKVDARTVNRSSNPTMDYTASQSEESSGPLESETSFSSGDGVEVTLTLRATKPMDYVMVEDPLPAGFEPQDRGAVDSYDWGNWWSEQIVRDRMVSFAVRRLEPGVRRITYYLTARSPGRYTGLPPRLFDMYQPERRAEGAAQAVEVRE